MSENKHAKQADYIGGGIENEGFDYFLRHYCGPDRVVEKYGPLPREVVAALNNYENSAAEAERVINKFVEDYRVEGVYYDE